MNITFSKNECIYNYFITTARRIATVGEINDYIKELNNYMQQNNINFNINNNIGKTILFDIYPLDKQIYYILDPNVDVRMLVENSRINLTAKVVSKMLEFDRLYTPKRDEEIYVLVGYYKTIKEKLMFQEKDELKRLININDRISIIDDILNKYENEVKYDRNKYLLY